MKPDRSRTVSFSGHRSFKMAGGATLFSGEEGLSARLHETVAGLAAGGYTDFICGMAEGFDLAAARAVLEVRRSFPEVRLHAYVPFPGQAAGFPPQIRSIYDEVLAGADSVRYLCPEFSSDCFHRRNDAMIADSSVLVCCYNGSAGGTRYTVGRAMKSGLRIINLAYQKYL